MSSADGTLDFFKLPAFMGPIYTSSDSFNLTASAAPFSDSSPGYFNMAALRAKMEEEYQRIHEQQKIADMRLFSVRRSQELCDGWIEVGDDTLPVHMAVVADISPIFKAAFSADSREAPSRTMVMNDLSRKSVDVILDFAYGIITKSLHTDVGLCLEVWRGAHQYQIDDLRQEVAAIASVYYSLEHRCQIFQHAMLYGSVHNMETAVTKLAKDIVVVARKCADFRDLDSKQMMLVLSSSELIATEDEKLEVMMKWKELNPAVSIDEVDDLFSWLRLERLKSTEEVEELLMSPNFPRSLTSKVHKLCFNKLKEDIVMSYMPLIEGDFRVFLRAEEWSYFSYCNLAMAACALKSNGFLLKCEHREKKSDAFLGYFSLQVKEEWFFLSVLHESPMCSGYLRYKIRFTREPFCVTVRFPERHVPTGEGYNDFWLTMSSTDIESTTYQKVWEKGNAEIYMTQVIVPKGD